MLVALGPYIAAFKTHIDAVSGFDDSTVQGLKSTAAKHGFMIFEDRKLVDIGSTVQKQYHGSALRISEWADIANFSILPCDGIAEALNETITNPDFPYANQRGLLVLADMTSKGTLATGDYTAQSVATARKFLQSVIGLVCTRALTEESELSEDKDEDLVIFTTGINMVSEGDKLGQQYQTPSQAVKRGADFVIAGRGIYAAEYPVEAAKAYQKDGWEAYLARTR